MSENRDGGTKRRRKKVGNGLIAERLSSDMETEDTDTAEDDEKNVRDLTGGMFEEVFTVSAEEAGDFLVGLGEQLQEGEEVTVTGDGWKIPFEFGDEVEIEVEYDGNEPELEFEIEIEGKTEDDEVPEIS
jgi:amphi-Trp domain-containing protein